MLVGYNHNIRHNDRLYHIQTEDTGDASMTVVTLLYVGGTIIASERTDYKDFATEPDCETQLRELMQNQHKGLLVKLRDGVFDSKTPPKVSEEVEVAALVPEETEAISILDAIKTMEQSKLDKIIMKHDSLKESGHDKGFDEVILDFLSKGVKSKDEEK